MRNVSRTQPTAPLPDFDPDLIKKALAEFEAETDINHDQFLDFMGKFLFPGNRLYFFRSVADLRGLIKSNGRIFPKDTRKHTTLRAIAEGVAKQGIEFFPENVRKKRVAQAKSKVSYSEILDRANEGQSKSSIAKVAGLSRNRVAQIIKEHSQA